MMRKILRSKLGHRVSVDAGRMDQFFEWRVAFERHTRSMHHERAMVQALLDGKPWAPGLTFSHDELAAIAPGVLMVLGSDEPGPGRGEIETVGFWQAFVDRIPGGEVHVVDDGGHMPWFDDPDGVGARVASFLAASPV